MSTISRVVFILCRSLICSGSEPFRPEEQLLSAEGEIFLLTNLATPLGNIYIYILVDLIFLNSSTLVRIQAPSPTLSSQICYLTQWILVWNFQICLDLNYFNLLCSFLFSIYQFLPWFDLFLTWYVILLCVLDLYKEALLCSWREAVAPPEPS